MPRYRVTLRRSSVEIVEASNQYQAAVVARDLFGDSVEVADVSPAVGRPPVSKGGRKTTKKVAKKRRPLSPEARAKLAQNLVKARAARAAKAKATKRAAKSTKTANKTTKKATKRVAKKR